MKITAEWLVGRDACSDQVAIFQREWPEGSEITPATLRRAQELELDLNWLAGAILNIEWDRYAVAEEAAWRTFTKVDAMLWEASAAARAHEVYAEIRLDLLWQAWQRVDARQVTARGNGPRGLGMPVSP